MADAYNPDEHTVTEVNDYLKDADDTERERVLAAERDGQARKGILGDEPEPTAVTATKGATFQEAAAAATPSDQGYIGYSPERERTGMTDKGLSQSNPAVMTGGQLPDPRQGVDDSEALKG